MTKPEPTPSQPTPPGPAPTLPDPTATPQDQSQRDNRKKIALRYVLDSITEATQELGADYTETGATAPSESLVSGLGGDGSVWKSTLADKIHIDAAAIIKRITVNFSTEKEKVAAQWGNEPSLVDWYDTRADWTTQ